LKFFGTNEKNYDNAIALLNEKQNEISEKTNKNNGDIVAFGLDFKNYKSSINEQFNEVWDFVKHMNSDIVEFKKWKEEQNKEEIATKEVKKELPDTLTCKEVADSLTGFVYLDQTSLKYYLYENNILDLKINRIRNTYRISDNFSNSDSEIKKYIHVSDGIITFDKDILDYFMNNSSRLQDSISRYVRKQKQFNESKQHLSEVEIKNFQTEIGIICGTSANGSYDKKKWSLIYKIYEKDHPNFWNDHKKYVDKYMEEHPNTQYKPTMITYLVKEVGDGDVLLKIACELFVK
jgi:hypothetical protein